MDIGQSKHHDCIDWKTLKFIIIITPYKQAYEPKKHIKDGQNYGQAAVLLLASVHKLLRKSETDQVQRGLCVKALTGKDYEDFSSWILIWLPARRTWLIPSHANSTCRRTPFTLLMDPDLMTPLTLLAYRNLNCLPPTMTKKLHSLPRVTDKAPPGPSLYDCTPSSNRPCGKLFCCRTSYYAVVAAAILELASSMWRRTGWRGEETVWPWLLV